MTALIKSRKYEFLFNETAPCLIFDRIPRSSLGNWQFVAVYGNANCITEHK